MHARHAARGIAPVLLLLATLAPRARAADTDAWRGLPSHDADHARVATPAAESEEHESPPQRLDKGTLEALGAAASAPEPVKGRFSAMGLGPGGLDWTFIGPRPITGEYWSSGGDVGGRVCAIAPHPTNPSLVYLAAAQGGVWKTTDAGATWAPLTEGLPSIASGALTIDPLVPTTLWYGTGEQNECGDCFYGAGLYQSTNGGTTWARVATTAQVGSYIARVLLATGSSDTLLVACNRGIVRSVNHGSTWTQVLATGWGDDIVADPVTRDHLVAAIDGKGLYLSTDAGATWTQTMTLPGRTNLAISRSNPTVVYASAATAPGALYGAYRSSDGGATWASLTVPRDYLGGQGWYNNVAIVSPTDSSTVLVGGVYPYNSSEGGIMRSRDAGVSWTDVTSGVDHVAVHPDQHAFAFGPDGTLWLGNDGGVWKTSDLGDHWTDCNATLAAAQLYTVAVHPSDPNDILAGTQDNGSIRYTGTVDWGVVSSGDGGPVMYERAAPNYFFTTYVRLDPVEEWNNGAYVRDVTGPWSGDRADWANGPLLEDPITSGTYYLGTQHLWKTVNQGVAWTAISGDLTAGAGDLRSVAISPLASGVFWTGASDGSIRRTRDGGTTWTVSTRMGGAVTAFVPSPTDTATAYASVDISSGARLVRSNDGGGTWTSVTPTLAAGLRGLSLAVDWRTSPERLYLGTDYGVYTSLDGGASWVNSSTNMPSLAVYGLAIDLPHSRLLAATHGRGMWTAALDVTGPALALTSPVGGESWPLSGARTITWTATDPSGVASVDLALSLDGGVTYPTVIASGLPNSGSYSWTVGPIATSNARVKVVAHDGLGQPSSSASAGNFWITVNASADAAGVAFALDPVAPGLGTGPFRVGFGLPAAANAAVDVYDAGGRRVRTLASGPFGAGEHTLVWDGRDATGGATAPGVYFVRLQSAGRDAVRRIAVLR